MATPETEIVVEDPTAPADDSPSVVSTRTVEIVVSLMLLALAVLLGYDNWRTGIAWASDGPQAGYFPFYLGLILAAASLYGLVTALVTGAGAGQTFVTRAQLSRVMQVFIPTLLFCLLTQWLGLYVASFLLIASFMRVDRAHCAVEIAAHRLPVRRHHVRHLRPRVRRHHAERTAGSGLRVLGRRGRLQTSESEH